MRQGCTIAEATARWWFFHSGYVAGDGVIMGSLGERAATWNTGGKTKVGSRVVSIPKQAQDQDNDDSDKSSKDKSVKEGNQILKKSSQTSMRGTL